MNKSQLKQIIRETIEEVVESNSSKLCSSLKGKTIANVEESGHVFSITFTDGTELYFDTPQMIGHKNAPTTNT